MKFVLENFGAVSLQFQSRKFVEFLGFVRSARSFCDLSAQNVAWQEKQRDIFLTGNRSDLIGIILRLTQLAHLQRNPAEQYQRLHFGKRSVQLAKTFHRFQRQRAGLPNAAKREYDFCNIEIDDGFPVRIPLFMEDGAGGAEDIQRLAELVALAKGQSQESFGFRQLIPHVQVPKLLYGAG